MIYYAKGAKMRRYPANSTIERLSAAGYRSIIWKNGDFIEF